MTNFLAIFKLDLLMSFKLSNGDKRKLAKKIGLIVLLLVAFAVPLGGVLIMLYFLSQVAVFGGYLDEILNLIFLTVQLAILIFFLPSYINTVWFSKDRQLLSSMPIGSTAVFVSRMLTIYLSALIISVLVTLTGGAVVAAGSASASETLFHGSYASRHTYVRHGGAVISADEDNLLLQAQFRCENRAYAHNIRRVFRFDICRILLSAKQYAEDSHRRKRKQL